MAAKTAVSIVNEYCQKRNRHVSFALVSSSGPPNDPVFVMTATVTSRSQTHVGEGMGKSKQDAKQKSAEAVLKKIRDDPTEGPFLPCDINRLLQPSSSESPQVIPSYTNTVAVSASDAVSSGTNQGTDLSSLDNAVGRLQDFCAQNNYPLPVYDCVSQVGESHKPIFTMKVSLGGNSATATARTKQQAKHEAARLLYVKISSKTGSSRILQVAAPPQVAPVQPFKKMSPEEVEFLIEKYDECKPLTTIPKTNPSLKFGTYHSSMEDLLSKVKDDFNEGMFSRPKEALRKLVEKLRLSITYHEARDISKQDLQNENCYVYAIVDTQPTTVQIGEGKSTQMAEAQAALTVLRYWQTFLGIFPSM